MFLRVKFWKSGNLVLYSCYSSFVITYITCYFLKIFVYFINIKLNLRKEKNVLFERLKFYLNLAYFYKVLYVKTKQIYIKS